jgi:hypothetical protein
MIMEVEFRISKYTQVFNTVGTGFGGLKKFIVEDQCISLPRQINRSDFIDVQFHKVCSIQTLYRINVRCKLSKVRGRFNGTENFDVLMIMNNNNNNATTTATTTITTTTTIFLYVILRNKMCFIE